MKSTTCKLEYIAQWQRDNKDKVAATVRRSNDKQNEKGLCRQCNSPLKHGTTQCEAHLARSVARQRFKSYGITQDEYDALLARQCGVCAICLNAPTGKSLSVDHDHVTGKVRGLLCNSCNNGLGRFRDSQELLGNAIAYLSED